jgi:dihydroorotate dehydrogenase electron transfer subunit
MTNLHATHYADGLHQIDAPLERNDEIGENTFLIRIAAPRIARTVLPGQFVMIRLTGIQAPLIGRALAVFDVVCDPSGAPTWIDLIYIRKGALTIPLSDCPPGTRVTLWGPLGNGFANRPSDRLIMVAGGIGQTPMLLIGREALGTQSFGDPPRDSGWANQVELIYGARRASLLAGVDAFRRAGFAVTLCTDDGSVGNHRLVPDVLADRLAELPPHEKVRVVTCGPEIMMEKVAQVCQSRGIDCQVSMETPMACGIGICFSCVAKIRQADPHDWDYKRTCVEGPIFDAEQICW